LNDVTEGPELTLLGHLAETERGIQHDFVVNATLQRGKSRKLWAVVSSSWNQCKQTSKDKLKLISQKLEVFGVSTSSLNLRSLIC